MIGVYSRKVCKKYVKSMYEVCQTTYYNHTAEGIKKTTLNQRVACNLKWIGLILYKLSISLTYTI